MTRYIIIIIIIIYSDILCHESRDSIRRILTNYNCISEREAYFIQFLSVSCIIYRLFKFVFVDNIIYVVFFRATQSNVSV